MRYSNLPIRISFSDRFPLFNYRIDAYTSIRRLPEFHFEQQSACPHSYVKIRRTVMDIPVVYFLIMIHAPPLTNINSPSVLKLHSAT